MTWLSAQLVVAALCLLCTGLGLVQEFFWAPRPGGSNATLLHVPHHHAPCERSMRCKSTIKLPID